MSRAPHDEREREQRRAEHDENDERWEKRRHAHVAMACKVGILSIVDDSFCVKRRRFKNSRKSWNFVHSQ